MVGTYEVSEMAINDDVLLEYIDKSLNMSEEKDFIFTITMETHSPYTETALMGEEISVTGDLPKDDLILFQNYVKQLSNVDLFLLELIKYVKNLEEHTVLVMYSDHYPHTLNTESLTKEEVETTFYYVLDNKDSLANVFPKEINSHELTSLVLNHYNINGGPLSNHQKNLTNKDSDDDTYLNDYILLQYDMVYGNNYISTYLNNRSLSDLTFGFDSLTINNVEIEGKNIIINGEGFNKFSKVFIDGSQVEMEYIDENLIIGNIESTEFTEISVKQVSSNNKVVYNSTSYTY